MENEYFDILNENGEKTGKVKERNKVHKDGDWHREVYIWVINKNNEILKEVLSELCAKVTFCAKRSRSN